MLVGMVLGAVVLWLVLSVLAAAHNRPTVIVVEREPDPQYGVMAPTDWTAPPAAAELPRATVYPPKPPGHQYQSCRDPNRPAAQRTIYGEQLWFKGKSR